MRLARAVVLASLSLPLAIQAQSTDSLRPGDRVRVTVAATRGNTNVFIGNVERISPETLVVAIPGGKGLITLPRLAISEVSVSDGRESRFASLPRALPFLVPTALLAALPLPRTGPHWAASRNRHYVFVGTELALFGSLFTRTPRERWQPVYGWLDHR